MEELTIMRSSAWFSFPCEAVIIRCLRKSNPLWIPLITAIYTSVTVVLFHSILVMFLVFHFSFPFSVLRDFFVEKHSPGEAFVEIQRVVVRATCDINLPPPPFHHCNKSCITNVAFPFILAYRLPINLFMEYETILFDWLLEIPLLM